MKTPTRLPPALRNALCYGAAAAIVLSLFLLTLHRLTAPTSSVLPAYELLAQILLGLPVFLWLLLPHTPDWLLILAAVASGLSWALVLGWLLSRIFKLLDHANPV